MSKGARWAGLRFLLALFEFIILIFVLALIFLMFDPDSTWGIILFYGSIAIGVSAVVIVWVDRIRDRHGL